MNEELEKFARNYLKENLKELNEKQCLIFKRMYSHKNLDLSIDDVVDNMDVDKLDWAMQQIMNSKRPTND